MVLSPQKPLFIDRPPILDELFRRPADPRSLIHGTVRYVEGEILPGARVTAFAGRDPSTEELSAPLASTYSDGAGGYEFVLEEPATVWVEAAMQGFARGRLLVPLARSVTVRRDLLLQPADSWVQGRVVELLIVEEVEVRLTEAEFSTRNLLPPHLDPSAVP